ncbi:hypothetical protein [Bradyrhizobium cenepequi]
MAQELPIVLLNGIGPEQPGRADPGKDVEIADAEHDFRPAVDDSRPGQR